MDSGAILTLDRILDRESIVVLLGLVGKIWAFLGA